MVRMLACFVTLDLSIITMSSALSTTATRMLSPKNLATACAALALLSASPDAQAQSGKVCARSNNPMRAVSLDLATGTLSRSARVQNRAATTTVDFSNNDLSGYMGIDTGGSFCEWFNAAVKGSGGNQSDLMSEVAFAYCSSKLDPLSGGPGGSVKLGFYEGYTLGGTTPSTPVALFTLTGLPANSANSSFYGGMNCYLMRVSFADLVNFADGPIGYSWKFLDTGTDGTLAATFPFLSCVASCSSALLQVDGQGMTDLIDEYCPPGYLLRQFTFGTTQGSFSSMSMDIREVTDRAATSLTYNALTTPNPDLLSATKAVIGGTWTATVTLAPPRNDGAGFTVVVKTDRYAPQNGFRPPPPFVGRGLTFGTKLASLGGIHSATTGSVSALIPLSLSLVGLHYACQATIFGGGVKLSSAVEGTTGTF